MAYFNIADVGPPHYKADTSHGAPTTKWHETHTRTSSLSTMICLQCMAPRKVRYLKSLLRLGPIASSLVLPCPLAGMKDRFLQLRDAFRKTFKHDPELYTRAPGRQAAAIKPADTHAQPYLQRAPCMHESCMFLRPCEPYRGAH